MISRLVRHAVSVLGLTSAIVATSGLTAAYAQSSKSTQASTSANTVVSNRAVDLVAPQTPIVAQDIQTPTQQQFPSVLI